MVVEDPRETELDGRTSKALATNQSLSSKDVELMGYFSHPVSLNFNIEEC